MRNLHIKYSSVHEICELVRVLDVQQFHRAWPEVLRFCRRSLCPANQTATVQHRVSC